MLAGLDAAISIEWGLLDPDTGNSFVSYNLVWRQARRIEGFLTEGAVTPGGVDIDLQWMVDRFLAPSVAKWSARAATEIAIDATDYETWARTTDYTPQAEVDADVFRHNHPQVQREDTTHRRRRCRARVPQRNVETSGRTLQWLLRSSSCTCSLIRKGRRHHSVAPHIVAMTLTPADEEAGPIGHEVAIQAKRVAPKLKVVKADQHYTRKKNAFVRRCANRAGKSS